MIGHLFRERVTPFDEVRTVIYPRPVQLELTLSRDAVGETGDSGLTRSRKGTDATEMFDIRSSQPGDDIRSIHWKLSGKTDELIVRQASDRTHYDLVILPDFGRKQGGLFVFTPTITKENGFWYQGTADAIYQNLNFLKNSHEPYVVIASGDCVYKMDYNKVLEYHIAKRADITVVCTTCPDPSEVERFGVLRMNEDCRIEEFEEKPMVSPYNTISTGIYVIRRRQLIELIEKAAQEGRNDFVKDILIRYKNLKRIYGYKIDSYWSNISTVESYYKTNMDFLKPEIRNYFFKQEPAVKTKIDDLPPAKYNPGADVKNSLISSGCIVNGVVENSVLFKDVYVGNNCVIKNSVILNDVYLGDNTHIENCIVESRGTIRANSYYSGDGEVEIVVEKNDRYSL